MSVKINIPSYLQPYADNMAVAEVDGDTVGECLNHLVTQFSSIEKLLFAQNGRLHSDVGVYINGEDTYPEELAKPVKDGDKLHIVYIIAGG